jgi:twitching motility protein PilT
MVDHINHTRTAHIVTIEDPIEVVHTDARSSISQRELGGDTKSFATAMRAALRQDPDVVLVGEMRDAETVATALMAAETGHLVLSTLHTTDATETLSRVVEFFAPFEQRQVRLVLAGVLKATICQRLLPAKDGASRVPATELMIVNGRVQRWIVDPAARDDVQEIISTGDYYGMHTFDQSMIELLRKGSIDVAAAMRNASNPHDLSVELRRLGLVGDTSATRPQHDLVADAAGRGDEAIEHLVERLAPPKPQQPPGSITPVRRPSLLRRLLRPSR